ncbi:MAG: CaiB/BaiF CoA-transferase family protein [Candidatus Binatia bacterium]|nr:CaiB/BaiF CoA-transferase family protein [Candidatus Binatia bacterium]
MSPEEKLGQAVRPPSLHGVRVLDFSHQAAGPWATTLLGDLGADVIKVEKPGRGDSIRYGQGEDGFEVGSLNFWGLNRSKRGITIDLGKPEGIGLVHRLVPECDVVLENFRPGVMDRKGIGYDVLKKLNPRLVYCGITAFGATGPMAQKPGMDLILQATGGIMSITGEAEGRPPVKAGPPVADITTGVYAAFAVAAALLERERSGLGQKIDLAMLDAVISLLADVGLKTHVGGRDFAPFGSGHPDIAPYQAFRASDGYFIVACLTGAFWKRLPAAIGRPELLDDPRFRNMKARVTNRDALADELNAVFGTQPVAHWIERVEASDIPTCRVNSLRDVFALEQLRTNETLVPVEHPTRGTIEILNSPIKMSGSPHHVTRGAPTLGQHTDEVLSSFGVDDAERERLRAAGVV